MLCRACDRLPALPKPLPTPEKLPVAGTPPAVAGEPVLALADLRMVELPVRADGTVVDWAAPILAAWDISEAAALAIMEQFLAEGAPLMTWPFSAVYPQGFVANVSAP